MDTDVKSISSYGTGWVFENGKKSVDLSKFQIGHGYYMYLAHIGAVEPLISNSFEGPYWYETVDTVKYILEATHMVGAFCGQFNCTKDTLDSKISSLISNGDGLSIKFFLASELINGDCVFGILDKDYFLDLAKENYGDTEKAFYDAIENGDITVKYK